MKVLVTGALGNVGRSTVNACIEAGHEVAVLEAPVPTILAKAKTLLRGPWASVKFVLGDIRDPDSSRRGLTAFPEGPDAVIHLAAMIPPAMDRKPDLAWAVNVGGTKHLAEACAALPHPPRLVLASSIALYGDRLRDFWIRTGDPLRPDDAYGRSKEICEGILRDSGLEFSILRLTYVVWSKWLKPDPLMFAMPPSTHLEVVHTEDAGRAFATAAFLPSAAGKTYNIGGGAQCRTFFRAYLDRMFRLFGLGSSEFLPDGSFARGGFHCGWLADSDEAEAELGFRRKTLEDYYDEVRWGTRFIRPFGALAAPLVRARLLAGSPHGTVKGLWKVNAAAGLQKSIPPLP
jgi:nucleoside-diphosphate-sugar epimerase